MFYNLIKKFQYFSACIPRHWQQFSSYCFLFSSLVQQVACLYALSSCLLWVLFLLSFLSFFFFQWDETQELVRTRLGRNYLPLVGIRIQNYAVTISFLLKSRSLFWRRLWIYFSLFLESPSPSHHSHEVILQKSSPWEPGRVSGRKDENMDGPLNCGPKSFLLLLPIPSLQW